MNFPSSTPSILDIPPGWGDTREEFRERVIQIIRDSFLWMNAPKYEIINSDESVTPFYPILCAASPEWWVITREEISDILYPKFVTRAMEAHHLATLYYADQLGGNEKFLAWGLKLWIFSSKEIRNIRFDHGNTLESYIREYRDPRLVEDIIDKLIHPYSPVSFIKETVSNSVDTHCCCCH